MKPRIVGFVQGRMNSTRLPGKVMADILGKPMIWHAWNRMSHASLLDACVICTSTNSHEVIDFSQRGKIPCYAGSESDLLNRYHDAATQLKADIIVRVTSDCPLVDPGLVDEVIRTFLEHKTPLDYVSNSRPRATYPHGLDVELFTFQALERAWNEIKDPFRREWLTTNFFEHPEQYRILNVSNSSDLSHYRLTVDYPADLDLVREIFKSLGSHGKIFRFREVIRMLSEHPELIKINEKHNRRDEGYQHELAKRGVKT